jgi:hypothetical protein
MRSSILHALAITTIVGGALLFPRAAQACGGCMHQVGENNTIITDHRMVFSISPQQTTLYDQIRYQGSPSSFAWVLPIKGTAKVGVSSDAVFGALDPLTNVQVFAPPRDCPAPPNTCAADAGTGGVAKGAEGGAFGGGGVDVLATETVGPYETVQLHASDPGALDAWLTQHGYAIPSDIAPLVAAYVSEGFDFLAIKLVPGQGVSAMRPIRVTTPGASTSLPLRMVAAGTGANVGITLWIVGDGRWEAQNFPNFLIKADDLVWDWDSSSSNFATLRTQKNASLGGAAWESESSIALNVNLVSTFVRQGSLRYDPKTGQQVDDYAPVSPAADAGAPDGGDTDAGSAPPASADVAFQEDMDALFGSSSPSSVLRITRLRSSLPHASLAKDLVIQASADQSELPTTLQVTHESGQPLCPVYDGDCNVTGQAPRDQAQQATDAATGGGGGCTTSRRDAGALSAGELGALLFAGVLAEHIRRRRRA